MRHTGKPVALPPIPPLGAHVLEGLLCSLRLLPATELELNATDTWEGTNRQIFKALTRMPLTPEPALSLPTLGMYDPFAQELGRSSIHVTS